jgi:hypothetical protein
LCHILRDSLPERIKRPERWEGEHHLAPWFKVRNQSLNCLEPIGPKEHHRKISSDAIERWQIGRQRTHVHALKPKPWQVRSLNRSRASDLTGTHIDSQHFTSRTNMLSQVKGGDPMAGCDIENA